MADSTINGTPVYHKDVKVPSPGDPVKSATPQGAVRPGYQSLLDNTEFLLLAARQQNVFYRAKTSCFTSPSILIEALGKIVLDDNTGAPQLVDHSTASTIDANLILGGTAGGNNAFTVNTRYYIYVQYNAGNPQFVINTNAPTADFQFETGPLWTHVFVGEFFVGNSKTILPYQQIGNRIDFQYYRTLGSGIIDNIILDSGTYASITFIPLPSNGVVPANIKELRLVGSMVLDTSFLIGAHGVSILDQIFYCSPSNGSSSSQTWRQSIPCANGAGFDYKVNTGGNAIWAAGYTR